MYPKPYQKVRLSVVFFIAFFLLLLFTQKTEAFNNKYVPYKEENITNNKKEPVTVLFLFDISRSVVGVASEGKSHCPKDEEPFLRKKALFYLLEVLKDLPQENSRLIHVGISTFGSKYMSGILPLTSSDKLSSDGYYTRVKAFLENDDVKDPSFEDSTDYATALTQGYNEIKNYTDNKNGMKKILVLLTDGFDPNSPEVENAIGNIPFDVEIYLAPVCPQTDGDLSFWKKHRIPTLGNGDWVEGIFQERFLTDIFPEQSGWIDGKISNFNVDMRGDINQVIFSYHSYYSAPSVKVNSLDFSGTTLPFLQSPKIGCGRQPYLWTVSSSDRGFWWVNLATRPKITDVEIDVIPQRITSDSVGIIEAKISASNLANGEFENWRSCFSNAIDLVFYSKDKKSVLQPGLSSQDCEGGISGDLCASEDGNTLVKKWKWYPPRLKKPDSIYVAPIYTDALTGKELRGTPIPVLVQFEPHILFLHKIPKPSLFDYLKGKDYFTVSTEFDITTPNIYLMRLSQSEIPDGCPSASNKKWHNFDVHVPVNNNNPNVFARTKRKAEDDLGTYELELNPIVWNLCGFDKLVFSWDQSDKYNVVASEYVCDLLTEECQVWIGD